MSAQPVPSPAPAEAGKAPADPRVASARNPLPYVLASLALLAPCYWQPRIQAGDLSSHIYNAWLAELIGTGRTSGLALVRQTTNVLFDLMLSAPFQWLGPGWAQRLAVSASVLVFAWGAFAFISAVSGRPAWRMLPLIAIFSYGWAFHMGFFNFYLALGFSFGALALVWQGRPSRLAGAALLFAAAYTAHALPVVWGLALVAYMWIFRRIPEHLRPRLLAVSLGILAGAHLLVRSTMPFSWSAFQLSAATGADQIWVFDGKYHLLMAVLLLIWGIFLLQLLHARGGRDVAASIPLHWCLLSAAGVFAIPSSVLLPGYHHALAYIAERMSLAVGICVCACLASGPSRRMPEYALAGLAVLFFVFLFFDERAMNHFEDRVERTVAQLPAGQRVVSPIVDEQLRVDPLTHMVDRACVGRCLSYANYEPSTAQFRIRALTPNPFVIADYGDSWDLQNGRYVVRQSDLPMFVLGVSPGGEVTIRDLNAGTATGTFLWNVLQNRPER